MKKVLFSLVFVAMSAMAFAQQWTGISKSSPTSPEVKLVSSSEQQVVIDFSLGGFYLTRVNTPNGVQQIVSVPKMAAELEAGLPDLPHYPVPVLIGDMAKMNVKVTASDYTDYNVEVAPSKGNISRQVDPATVLYTYGEMYSQNAFYPAAQATLDAPYILRDCRGQNIVVRPFAYNPVTKTLRVYHHLTISMDKVGDNGENPKLSRKGTFKVDPEMKQAYSRRFINFAENATKYIFDEDRGEMLVICTDVYMDNLQPLVDWKNQSGRPTTLVSLSEAGGNNIENIKNYVRNFYNDPAHNLEYVLLVGEYNNLTPKNLGNGSGGTVYSDNYIGKLEGNDDYLEVLVGRLSVANAEDADLQVNKMIYYERDVTADATWGNRGMGIGYYGAGSGHYGEDDYQHIDFIRDTLLHYTYETVTEHHGGSGGDASVATISGTINEGIGIINYCNHGSETSWGVANYSTSHVASLTNDYMLPFVWSVACLNGKFDVGTCFAESWLRAKNNTTGAPTGAVGGMFSYVSQPWIPPMYGQDEMVDILTEWCNVDQFNHTFGGASLNGSMYILDIAPNDSYQTFNSWLLFGDPSLMVRTDNPTEMKATINPDVLMLGMSTLEVNTDDTPYGIATLMMDGEVIATGYIQDNTCTLEFAPMSNVGTASLTVVGYNKVTEIIPVEVLPAEGPYVTVSGYTPNFAPVNQETNLTVSFKNVGVDPTNGYTNVSLTCSDPRLQIINGTAQFAVLPAEETITLQDAFSFIVEEGVEDGTTFQISIEMNDGRQTWNGRLNITAGQAILDYAGANWAGSYEPGEELTLVASFKNAGHYMATNAIATIACESPYVTILNPNVEYGTIDPEGVAYCVFNVAIDPDCPATEQIPVSFTMQADGELISEGSLTLKNTCNVVFELSDSYGDGWNGNKLRVSFSDGTPAVELTIESGNSATQTLEIGRGVHVTLTWVMGNYSYECSFVVKYEDGTIIYQSNNISGGVLHEFDCNCDSGSGSASYAPVENLEAAIGIGTVDLTWTAPLGASTYTIYRNGIEIGQTIGASYTDEVWSEIHFTYCVVANYLGGGSSVPECIDVKAELGIEEGEAEFSIYPNPTHGTLYINGGNAEYTYTMLNNMGQVVANGQAQGTEQISTNGFAKGVYFLRLTSGTQMRVEKVVVK